MLEIQSGQPLAALSPLRPFRPCAVVACATLIALAGPLAARAQAQVPQVRQASDLRSDPRDAQASVPPLAHESAFTRYRHLTDVPVGSWRDANDTVNRIGGWRVYAREAAQPASSAASAPAGSVSPPGMKPADPAWVAPMPGGKHPDDGHQTK